MSNISTSPFALPLPSYTKNIYVKKSQGQIGYLEKWDPDLRMGALIQAPSTTAYLKLRPMAALAATGQESAPMFRNETPGEKSTHQEHRSEPIEKSCRDNARGVYMNLI